MFSDMTGSQKVWGSFSVDRVNIPLFASAPGAVDAVEEQTPAADTSAPEKETAAAAEKSAEEKDKSEKKDGAKAEAKPAGPPPPQDKTMYLTVPKMGLYDNAVYNSSDPATLDVGAAKLKEAGFPWQKSANPYISAHRLGWPGTASYYQFYNLPLMAYGDPIYLTDANGTTYTYEVTEVFEVAPNEVWVSKPVAGRDMISLQTCTENYGDYWTMGPTWSTRYVVRGDRIDVNHA
ncbi:hypothetical protein BH23ACT11_BH23ACT11_31280 [soil metagenome]